MSHRSLVVFAGTGIVVVGLALLFRPGPTPLDPEVARARVRVAELEQEVAALRLEVERLRSLGVPVAVAERTSEMKAPGPATIAPPESTKPPSSTELPVSPSSQAAAEWLEQKFPDLFPGLTAEEARYLRTLDLSKQTLTKEELALLAGLEHLVDLKLGRNGSDDALKSLGNLNHLRFLDLGSAPVTLAGLQCLPAENLRSLHVQDTQLTDDDVAAFRHLDHLTKLKLDRTKLSDAAMSMLGDCTSLRHIELDQTGITAAGVRTLLRRNPDLQRLEVRGTSVSREEAEELHREFPNTVIVSEQAPTAVQLFGGR